MSQNDLDRILSEDDEIIPSSGFVGSVMEAVRLEAMTPPPIPFPWKRALPGLAMAVLLFARFIILNFRQLTQAAAAPSFVESLPLQPGLFLQTAVLPPAGWIALVLVLTLGSLMLSRRLAGVRT